MDWLLVHPVHSQVTALGTLPSSSEGVVLRSRFSVMGSEAGYSETVDGDCSDFELPFGVYRQ